MKISTTNSGRARRVTPRIAGGLAVALTATLLPAIVSGPAAATRLAVPEDRYAMAGGCYAVRDIASDRYVVRSGASYAATAADLSSAEPFHFQATDLGMYLLYDTQANHLAADAGAIGDVAATIQRSTAGGIADGLSAGATDTALDAAADGPIGVAAGRGSKIVAAAVASELADWTIETAGGTFTLTLDATDQALVTGAAGALGLGSSPSAYELRLTGGCATFPEIEVGIDGPVAKGPSATAPVQGFVDAHVHMMAFEFVGGRSRCGRPWHRYGVTHAMVDCPDHEPGGRGGALEAVLTGDGTSHDTKGWPTFGYWPKYNSLTHEQLYYKGLERAWRGGLRIFVNLLVDNAALCKIYPYRQNSCNEMDGVRLQAQRVRELERYIDAQSGGPGEGWFRIVTDPIQARRVINDGKLAVVLGIEVSTPLDCGLVRDIPTCDEAKISAEMAKVYHDLGVRQMEMVNKFDNALSGVTGDGGQTGVVVNQGNLSETGSYWQMQPCEDGHEHDKAQINVHDQAGTPSELTGRDSIFAGVLSQAAAQGVPAYPPGPHCNRRGLTNLGRHMLDQMMRMGMIFDPDHMSAKARTESLDHLEAAGYPGLISSHSWADDTTYRRIIQSGGLVTPYAGSAQGFVNAWTKEKAWADPQFGYALGFGSDVNGFGAQGAPRGANNANKVTYPFTGFGGAIVSKQRAGQRLYDINTDGVAQYGLYPDWIEDLRKIAGQAIVDDLAKGAEAYLQVWERAVLWEP